MQKPEVSVVISTYNQPEWLQKVLIGYQCQSETRFEVIIADDGSTEETALLVQKFAKQSFFDIKHVWQEDDGFRKTRILNKAIQQTTTDYLLFTDGDCIPRRDFVSVHLSKRKQGWFLSGGYFKLPQNISKQIDVEDIKSQRCFNANWLLEQGLKKSFKLNKLTASGIKEKLLNRFTPTKATWDGMNVSGWKKDVIEANGFDERMQYGGEDRELGERLFNAGIKAKQIRYSAICLHLFHDRSYVAQEMIDRNKEIRKETQKKKLTKTRYGINKS